MKPGSARQWTSLCLIAGFLLAVGAGVATQSSEVFWLWEGSANGMIFSLVGILYWMGFIGDKS